MVRRLVCVVTQDKIVYNTALGSDSHHPEECDPTIASLSESEGATRKSKKVTSGKRNLRGGTLIIVHSYTR